MIEIKCDDLPNLVGHIGLPAMLEQTAEEATEFAHACLKYARFFRNENDTYKPVKEIEANFHEETADIMLCIEELVISGILDPLNVDDWTKQKVTRMKKRLDKEV